MAIEHGREERPMPVKNEVSLCSINSRVSVTQPCSYDVCQFRILRPTDTAYSVLLFLDTIVIPPLMFHVLVHGPADANHSAGKNTYVYLSRAIASDGKGCG